MRHRILETFTGPFALVQNEDGSIWTTWMTAEVRNSLAFSREDRALAPDLWQRLKRYFDGDRVNFNDVTLPEGGEFYRRCWRACRSIPRGQTRSYGELAELAGSSPAAARAAGQAMRHNPLPIIVPCHRVVASDGRLHGFGGSCDPSCQALAVKRALLAMEGAIPTGAAYRTTANKRSPDLVLS